MKKIIFFTALLFTYLLFLPACLFEGGGFGNDLSFLVSETESDKTRDGRSDSGGLCRDDNDCEDICEDVYDDASDEENDGKIEACGDLKYRIAIQFESIMEALESPYESSLRNIDHKIFLEFLDVSLEPWIRSTRPRSVSNSEAEDLLVWVAKEKRISDAIVEAYQNYEREYDKFEGVANLFEKIASELTGCSGEVQKCAEMFNAITETAIVGSHISFWDIVQETISLSATAISCEIFSQRCGDVQASEAAGCGVVITDYESFSTLCGL